MREALDVYRNTFKRDPLPNEMISGGDESKPAQRLITNYAMLEYCCSPDDSVFFDGAVPATGALLCWTKLTPIQV